MNDDTLRRMLLDADLAAGRPTLRPDVAGRVMRRRRRKRLTGGGAILAIVAIVALVVTPVRRHTQPWSPGRTQTVAVAPLNPFDAVVAQKTAEAILLHRRQENALANAPLDPRPGIRLEVDETAMFLISAGDQMSHDPRRASQAADEYRRVETCFPGTPWAAAASQRLRQLHS